MEDTFGKYLDVQRGSGRVAPLTANNPLSALSAGSGLFLLSR
jgi:hypothetical protein